MTKEIISTQEESTKEYILGLDVSTTTMGVCVIDNKDGSIVFMDYLKLNTNKKEYTLLDKVKMIKEYIKSVCIQYNIIQICIEDFLKSYVGTNKNAIIMLAQINSITQYIISDSFADKKLSVINVRTARKKVVGTIKGKKQKEVVFEWFCAKGLWEFPQTKYENYIKEARDMVDAYVVCMGCWMFK